MPFDTSDATIRGSSGSSSLAAMLHLDALWKHTEPRFRDQDTWHGGYLPGEHKSVLTSLVIPDKELRSLEELVDARRRAAGEEPSPAAPRILSGVDLEFALQLIVPEGPNRNDALPSPE